MVSCNVGLTSALTSFLLFQKPRLRSDIQHLSTGIGLAPSPTRCNIRSDLTVSVTAFFSIFLICRIKYYKKNMNISQGDFSLITEQLIFQFFNVFFYHGNNLPKFFITFSRRIFKFPVIIKWSSDKRTLNSTSHRNHNIR